MGRRLLRALFASASILFTLGQSGIALAHDAHDHDALDLRLARSLPDVAHWLAPSAGRFTERFGVTLPLARERERERRDPLVIPVATAPALRDARWIAEVPPPSTDWPQLSTSRELATLPVPFMLPAAIALTFDQFTDSTREGEHHLRFADVGAMVTFPLVATLARCGRLTFSAGAHLRFFDPEMRAGNGGDATQWIGCAGISLSF